MIFTSAPVISVVLWPEMPTFVSPVGIDDAGWSARDPEAPADGDEEPDGNLMLPFTAQGADE
ncbi:MAG TPA: hypothetical protein VH374_10785 [Polyangia bacterium]|nr:hypothetical protein [Polyangia bacterium]